MLEKTKGEKKDAIVKIGEKREKERKREERNRLLGSIYDRVNGYRSQTVEKRSRFLCKNFEFQKIVCIREGYL